MQTFRSALFAALFATLSVTASAATDPNVGPSVVAVPTTVTLSRDGLTTFAGYKLTVANNTTNNLNRITLDGTAVVVGGAVGAVAAYDSFETISGPTVQTCGVGSASNKVHCDLGSLAPNQSLALFVVFKAPTSGSRIDFNWAAGGKEGNSNTGKGCCVTPGTTSTALVDATTDASYKKNATTFLKSTGGSLFTGDQGKANSGDPWATSVVISAGTGIDYTATIAESNNPTEYVCGTSVPTCFISSLNIPGSFTLLSITLTRDVSTIPQAVRYKQSALDEAKIFYSKEPVGSLLYNPVEVYACSLGGPSPGVPCWVSKIVYPKAAPADVQGDWKIEIQALDNGSYRF